MQMSAMKTCFHIAECSLSSAKININPEIQASHGELFNTLAPRCHILAAIQPSEGARQKHGRMLPATTCRMDTGKSLSAQNSPDLSKNRLKMSRNMLCFL